MKEHKKLYKAKKNWIIGMIAGMALVFGGGINANADTEVQSQAANVEKTTNQQSDYGTNDQIKISGNDEVSPVQNMKNHNLSDNVTIKTSPHSNIFDSGFKYEMNNREIGNLNNNEYVTYYYYHTNDPYSGEHPEYDNDIYNQKVGASHVFPDGTPLVETSHGPYDQQRKITMGDNVENATEINNHDLAGIDEDYGKKAPINKATLKRTVTVKENTITNKIDLNVSGQVINNGSWGIAIEPQWSRNILDDITNNFFDTDNTYIPYKLDNTFYYVIRNIKKQPLWIEVIRPGDGLEMFSGATSLGEKDPILGGRLLKFKDGNPNRMFIIAPEGKSAKISYIESYYKINDIVNAFCHAKFVNANTGEVVAVKKVKKGEKVTPPHGYVFTSDHDLKSMYVNGDVEINVSRILTLRFISELTGEQVGDEVQTIASKENITQKIKSNIPSQYKIVLIDGKPKYHLSNGLLNVFVAPKDLNPNLVGSVDLSKGEKGNINFEKEKLKELGIDSWEKSGDIGAKLVDYFNSKIPGAGDALSDFSKYISLGQKLAANGLDEDNVGELTSDISTSISNFLNAAVKLTGKGVGKKIIKSVDIFGDIGEFGADLNTAVTKGLSSTLDEHKYQKAYLHHRNKNNRNERKANFEETRDKQMNSIFSSLGLIQSSVGKFFEDNPVAGIVATLALSFVAIICVFLTKYLWYAVNGERMSGIFGLKMKNIDKGLLDTKINKSLEKISHAEKGNGINGGHNGPLSK